MIEIEYWTHEDAARKELEERLIAQFESENPDIKVKRTEYGSAEIIGMIKASCEAGEGPDLFNLPSEEIWTLLEGGFLEPYPGDTSKYIPGAFEAVDKDERVYGLPLEYTSWCLYINKRIFRDAGIDSEIPPATWESIVDASEALSIRDGAVLLRRGFDFRYPYYLSFFIPMVRQLGGDLFGPDGSAIVGEKAWEEALLFMKEWGPLGRNLGSPTYINARTLFNSEEIAMCLSGLYQESRMMGQNPAFYESGEWMVAPFPVFEDSVSDESASHYFHYFLVNSNSDDSVKDASWALASFFASHAMEYLDEIGLIMPLAEVLSSEALLAKPYADVFLSDIGRSKPIYSGPNASEIQRLIGDAVESVMLFSNPPEKAVQALRVSIEALQR